jgi:hypothetical protein
VWRRKVKRNKDRKKKRKVLQLLAHVTWKVRVCGNYVYASSGKYLKMRIHIFLDLQVTQRCRVIRMLKL